MPLPFQIVRETSRWLAITKPVGWLSVPPDHSSVHRESRRPCVTDALREHYPDIVRQFSDPQRCGAVHRLDRDTSGLLLIAKDPEAHEAFREIWRRREITKFYWALVLGHPAADDQDIREPIYYASSDHVLDEREAIFLGLPRSARREAHTQFQVRERFDLPNGERYSFLQVRIFTGRTHQIRFHMHHLGYPVFHEPYYRPREVSTHSAFPFLNSQFEGHALHARRLEFTDPFSGERVVLRSDPPTLPVRRGQRMGGSLTTALTYLRSASALRV